jgi:AraC-like DNA-binding protein
MSQTTLLTIPRLISQVLSVYDVDIGPVFKQVQIDLNNKNNYRISMDKLANLWQLAVESSQNPNLGIVAASLFQPAYLKGIGLAWMASENLEEGLRRFVHSSQLINTLMQIELVEQGDELLIQYQGKSSKQDKIKAHHCAIELGVGFFLKMFRLAAGKTIPATGVYFTFEVDKRNRSYQDFFQCPVYGNQEMNGISFSKSLLTETLPTHDSELVELNEMLISKHLNNLKKGDISTKVIKIIHELLPSGCPSEEIIAFKLHMSKRTLQRKLKAEGQAFLPILTSVRIMLAKQFLNLNVLSITEIAYQLGYSSPSTFARAFKKQTTVSPVEFKGNNNGLK